MQIPIFSGGFTLIDDEDFDRPLSYQHRDGTVLATKIRDRPWYMSGGPRSRVPCTFLWINHHSYRVTMHRLILRATPGQAVDHIDGNSLDNRKCNLRFATNSQNQANAHRTHGRSRFKGVSYYPNHKRQWMARLRHLGTRFNLGSYKTEEEAAIVYNAKALELFGEFACLNEVI